MNSQELVVWWKAGCTTIGAPEMSLANGFVLDDNTIDYSDPDNGIFWTRSCVWQNPDEKDYKGVLVIEKDTGSLVAEFANENDAEEFIKTSHHEEDLTIVDADEDSKRESEMRVWHRRTCVVSGDECARAMAIQVHGVMVLVRDEHATNTCGLIDPNDIPK